MRQLAIELLQWLPVGAMPIINGAIRLATYQEALGEPAAGWVSAGLDCLFVMTYAAVLPPARRPAVRMTVWLAATTLLHFALGGLVFGMAPTELLGKYNIAAGEAWLLVNLAIAAGPWLGVRLRRRRAAKGQAQAALRRLAPLSVRNASPDFAPSARAGRGIVRVGCAGQVPARGLDQRLPINGD